MFKQKWYGRFLFKYSNKWLSISTNMYNYTDKKKQYLKSLHVGIFMMYKTQICITKHKAD